MLPADVTHNAAAARRGLGGKLQFSDRGDYRIVLNI